MKRITLPLTFIFYLLAACGNGPEETAQVPGTSTPFALPQIWTTTPIPTETITQNPTPPDETITLWETYRNEKHGYEIQHPLGWVVSPSIGSEHKVSIENEHCIFTIEGGKKGDIELNEVTLPSEECSLDVIDLNDKSIAIIACPDGYTEYHYLWIAGYLTIKLGEKIQDIETYPANLMRCQEYFDQMLSTFRVLREEGIESTILEKTLEKLPQGFEIEESIYVDLDGDGVKEISVIRGPIFEERPDIYIFKQDPITTDVIEIYFEEGHGEYINQSSASDLDKDGKEELLIILNLGDDPDRADWYLLVEKDSVVQRLDDSLIKPSYFGLGEEYSFDASGSVSLIGDGLIREYKPLHLEGTESPHAFPGSRLDVYYHFQSYEIAVFAYELSPPEDSSEWKVYRDVAHSFEIRYPQDADLTKQAEDRIQIAFPFQIHFLESETSEGTTPEFTVQLNAYLEITTLNMDCRYQECLYPTDVADTDIQWHDFNDTCELTSVHSDGAAGSSYTSKKYLCFTPEKDRQIELSLVLRHPSSLGTYLSSYPPGFEERLYSGIAQHEEIVDQILSTFRMFEE